MHFSQVAKFSGLHIGHKHVQITVREEQKVARKIKWEDLSKELTGRMRGSEERTF